MGEMSFFKGYANAKATSGFHERFLKAASQENPQAAALHKDKRRGFCGVEVSAMALGTYLGRMDYPTDLAVTKAALNVVANGINFFDTAINYRGQRGEKSLGDALRQLILSQAISRDEIFISTKGGFIPFDGEPTEDPKALFLKNYVDQGLALPTDLIAECHCLAPKYLSNQIDRSRKNLQIETIDLYYLHNPETQLEELPDRIFYEKLFDAFRTLESARAENKIRGFGLATWDGFREVPQAQTYLHLERIIQVAKQAAPRENDSGFKAIQLPFNLGMLEAKFLGSQKISGHAASLTSLDRQLSVNSPATPRAAISHEEITTDAISAAKHFGLDVAISAPLIQGQLSNLSELPPFLQKHIKEGESASVFALNFVLSIAGVDAVMVGMKDPKHITEDLHALQIPNFTPSEIQAVLDSLQNRS